MGRKEERINKSHEDVARPPLLTHRGVRLANKHAILSVRGLEEESNGDG